VKNQAAAATPLYAIARFNADLNRLAVKQRKLTWLYQIGLRALFQDLADCGWVTAKTAQGS
jgi:hypothetical protein